jgi:excisionase family DNA binding protein
MHCAPHTEAVQPIGVGPAHDLVAELAKLVPVALDDDALRALASRLRPFLENQEDGVCRSGQLLTASAAARLAGVNVETVRRAIRAGDLEAAARIGRSHRIARPALDSWLASTTRGSTPRHSAPRARRRAREARKVLSLITAFSVDD